MAITSATVALIGVATTAVATGIQIYSNFQQAQAQAAAQAAQNRAASRQAAFQAQQQTLQAKQLAMQAEQTRMGADQTRMQQEMAMLSARSEATEMFNEQLRLEAKQRAQAAAAGYELDSTSFMSIVAATASKADQDREQVLRNGRYNAAVIGVSAQGQLVQAAAQDFSATSAIVNSNNLMQQSYQYKKNADHAYDNMGSAWINSAGALVSGAGSALYWADKGGWFDNKPKKSSQPKTYLV